ncbi:MAG: hypothetical protein LC676_11150 [Loktanella sp.]|nr:hypothetical protein [Loktanella sp.]
MTDIAHFQRGGATRRRGRAAGPSFWVNETFWGYVVRAEGRPSPVVLVTQALSMLIAAAMIVVAFGLWLSPASFVESSDLVFRGVASVTLVATAAVLLWHASRGTKVELQVDLNMAEVREVVNNRAGRATLLGRHGFDAIGGVFIDRSRGRGASTLCLRYRNTSQMLFVASGDDADLEGLCGRLGRDLVLDRRKSA